MTKAERKDSRRKKCVESIKKIVMEHGRKDGDMYILDNEPICAQDVCVDGAVIEDDVLKFGNFRDGRWEFYRDENNMNPDCLETTMKDLKKRKDIRK